MTSAPIYLVSACSSGEEFVSAFRRYADRNGVIFIPIAEPLPAGRRGRFAVTLIDGGVMLEGQAEVVSSARSPSVLHGRVGMTVKFLAPDEPSKVLLGELEKARTALRPAAPTVAPRATTLPEATRPKPPPAGGRVDSINALAECIVLGDVSSLSRDSDLSTIPPVTAPIPSSLPRVPSSPIAVPNPRRGTTTPPPLTTIPAAPAERLKTPSIPPLLPSLPGSGPVGKTTTLGVPSIDRRPSSGPVPVVPPPRPAPMDLTTTMRGPAPGPKLAPLAPLAPLSIAPPPPIIIETPDEPTDLTDILAGGPTIEQPAVDPRSFGRRTEMGVAVTPSGMHVLPALVGEGGRDTTQMEAIDLPDPDAGGREVDALGETMLPQPPLPAAMRAPVVEEASGDWIMAPGDAGPTITPREPEKTAGGPARGALKGPPTGNWTIALDPSQPDGWSEPSKVDALPYVEPGPPKSMVSSDAPLDSNRAQPQVEVGNEPKIQIDPTLIEPLATIPTMDPDEVLASSDSLPAIAAPPRAASPALGALGASGPSGAMPALGATPALGAAPVTTMPGMGRLGVRPAPPPRSEAAGSGVFVDRVDEGRPAAATKRRTMIIVAIVVGALALAAVLFLVLSGRSDSASSVTAPRPTTDKPTPTTSELATGTVPDAGLDAAIADVDASAQVAVAPVDAAIDVVGETPAIAAPTDCPVTIASVPSGAEITRDDAVVGTTPTTLTLPCGVEAKVVLKKARYQAIARTFTPKPKQKAVKITLPRTTFSVKVSSSPAGATVYLGARSLGVTPTTVKLPSFEASTVKFVKDGYTAETQKVTPKNNSQAVSVTLKKSARAAPKRR